MKIDEFCAHHGANVRNVNDVLRRWELTELDGSLRTLQDQHDQFIGTAVIVGDALHGDGMLDQIPRELKNAFTNLMQEKADSYNEMRRILVEHIRDENGRYLSLDSRQVVGFISKIKGQIGENLFQHHVGHGALLAKSAVQEGWDVSVPHADGLQYVQVKLYSDAHGVVHHMLNVHEKVQAGSIMGVDGEPVKHIFFAVPEDIKGDLHRIVAEHHPDLQSMIHETSVPIDAHSGASIVREGMCNVGPHQLCHFFRQLLGGAVVAGSLHAAVNGFLWYKGAKEFSEAFASTLASTAISTTGIGIGLVVESFYHTAMLSSVVGIGSRVFLGRMARSRWNFAEFLEKTIAVDEARIAKLAIA